MFIRESIEINPLRTRRDWLVVVAVAGTVALAALLMTPERTHYFLRGALAGVLCSGLPSLIMCLPVRGRVEAANSASFLVRVAQRGFMPAGETAEGRVYIPTHLCRMTWSSNRIVIRDDVGALQVTVPLHFYVAQDFADSDVLCGLPPSCQGHDCGAGRDDQRILN